MLHLGKTDGSVLIKYLKKDVECLDIEKIFKEKQLIKGVIL